MNPFAPNRHSEHTSDVPDDLTLLARVAQRDAKALELLYYRHVQKLQRFAYRITRCPGLAEEVVNDTMMIVWKNAGHFRAESRVSTWLFGIAYRCALKAGAQRQRHLPLEDSAEPNVEWPSDISERRDWIATAMLQLSDEHRAVIELAYFFGFSCEETARIVDCPVGTVKTRLFHARAQLHRELTKVSEPTLSNEIRSEVV